MAGHHVHVTLLGERIDTRALDDLEPPERRAFLERVRPLVTPTFDEPESEDADLLVDPDATEGAADGVVVLNDLSIPRLQATAEVLAKSVVLAHHEEAIAATFDRIDPLARELAAGRGAGVSGRRLKKIIGRVLLAQHRMVGRGSST